MEDYKISKDIPIPEPKTKTSVKQGRRFKYPFEQLDVNDSFLVPLEIEFDYEKVVSSITSCKANAQKSLGIKMKTRKVFENDKFGIRVWRVQ